MSHSRTLAFTIGRYIDVWHVDTDPGRHSCASRPGWRWHVHHWRIRSTRLISLRRRLLTRCAWCKGRHLRADPVNTGHPGTPRAPWWRGEIHLFHGDCIRIHDAHATCLCDTPLPEHESHGPCASCGKFRPYGLTPERLAQERVLAAIPTGRRAAQE